MRRPAKFVIWSVATLLFLLVLSGGVVMIVGNTDFGRGAIQKLTRRLTGGTVQISGLAGSFPSRLSVEHLELSDDRGVWLSADRIAIEWTPAALLERRVSVQMLHAAEVSMQRLPHSTSTSSKEASIPRIDLDKVDIDRVDLGAELAGIEASLVLHGDARLRSVREMQFDATAQRIGADGEYDLHLIFDAKRMQTVLKVHEPANGPLENILSLPGLGALTAALNFDGLRSAEKLQLSLQAGGLTGHAEGTLNLIDLTADLNFEFESTGMQPRADLGWSHAAARGRWLGSIKAPNATAHLDVAGLHTPGGIQLTNLNADLSAENGAASLLGEVVGLQIPGPQPSLLARDPVRFDATINLDQASRPLQISANHKLVSLRARWLTAGKQSATLQLQLPDLTPFAALAGQSAGGSASIQGQLDYADAKARVSLAVDAGLRPNAQSWLNMLGPRTRVQLAGTVAGDAIVLENFKVSGSTLEAAASGNLSLPQRNLRAKWNVNSSDLSTLSPSIAGTLSASGSVQGALTAMTLEAQADSKLSVRGSSAELSAKVQMQGIPSAPAGTLSAQGLLDGSTLQADIALEKSAAGLLHTVVRQATWRSAHVDGDVTTLKNGTSRGEVSLRVGQLRDLQHLIGADISGAAVAKIDLSPEIERTRLRLEFDTEDLAIGALAGKLHVSGEGLSDAFAIKVDAAIPKLGTGPALFEGAATLDIGARHLNLSSASVNYHGQDIRLLAPARLDFADGLSVDSLKLGAQRAQLEVQGRAFPETSLRVALSNVEPKLVNAFIPNLLSEGRVDAHAELQGNLQSPSGQVSLKAAGVRFADDAALGLPAADLTADAQLLGSTADFNVHLVAGAGSQLNISGRAPMAQSGALDLKLAGSMPVSLFNPLLEARGQHAAGLLEVNAAITGSVAEPQMGGTLSLSQGGFRDYGRGVNLTAINAQLRGSGAALQIESLSATAAPGTVAVTGSIGVLQPKRPVDLKITARNAQPVVSKLVTANLDADLHVSGTLAEHLDIGGNVHLNRTLIGIPNSLPPNVAVLDVRRHGTAAPPAPDKPLMIAMDIKVQAPRQILVQGRGLDAEMGGELQISGTTDSPRVSGGFDLQRGSFSLASSKLNFTAGRVGFSGEGLHNKIDPTLDFTADTSIPQGTATLHIGGYADAPEFEFTSIPPMPQDQILAYLMFGENASQLTALQLAEIGAALASLSGVGGDSPLVKVQKTLGLDRLAIGSGTTTNATGAETGASIQAGRYISKRVYIEAKQSTTGTSQLEADINLTKRLKLQTRLGNGSASVQGTTPENDPGSSIGLIYQFEY